MTKYSDGWFANRIVEEVDAHGYGFKCECKSTREGNDITYKWVWWTIGGSYEQSSNGEMTINAIDGKVTRFEEDIGIYSSCATPEEIRGIVAPVCAQDGEMRAKSFPTTAWEFDDDSETWLLPA